MTDQRLDAEQEAGRSQGDITQVKENRIDSYGWTGWGDWSDRLISVKFVLCGK